MHLTDGTTFSHQVQDYPGMPSRPFTWDDAAGKFDQLTVGRRVITLCRSGASRKPAVVAFRKALKKAVRTVSSH